MGGGVVVAVDTFLGSAEHYLSPEPSENASIGLSDRGSLNLLGTFISNIEHFNLQNRVIALPLDSQSAATLVSETGIRPDLVHIDAGHSYMSVMYDLISWFEILKPGGTMVCDDYNTWTSVRQAIDAFKSFTEVFNFQISKNKCSFEKPTILKSGIRYFQEDVEVDRADEKLLTLSSEIVRLQKALELANVQISAQLNATSWRITKPLRIIKETIMRYRMRNKAT